MLRPDQDLDMILDSTHSIVQICNTLKKQSFSLHTSHMLHVVKGFRQNTLVTNYY